MTVEVPLVVIAFFLGIAFTVVCEIIVIKHVSDSEEKAKKELIDKYVEMYIAKTTKEEDKDKEE